jgi:hypothetical protein
MSILKDKGKESYSLTRIEAVIVSSILSIGFGILCFKGRTTWEVFIAYPFGVIISLSPQLFLRMIKSLKETIIAWKNGE